MNNKEIYFSIGEREVIEALREQFDITYVEACDRVLGQKRQAAYAYSMQGHFDLAEQMLREIHEWNDEVAKEFDSRGRQAQVQETKIIMPGEE